MPKNRDAEQFYAEIAKANGIPVATSRRSKASFASWIDQAQSGWWIQDARWELAENNAANAEAAVRRRVI